MFILVDLDGTLTDTAHEKYKLFKDGMQEVNAADIPVIKGAKEFIRDIIIMGHKPIIISDSHPKYVDELAEKVFKIPSLSLSDKPNPTKTLKFLKNKFPDLSDIKNQVLVIGDTWLDIELGRSLNCSTILTSFYKATSEEQRDGIGQDWKQLKSGPTYHVKNFKEIFDILENPLENLLAIEAAFQNSNSIKAARFKTDFHTNRFIAFRTLGRQNAGECDKYAVADKYFEFQREDRSAVTLKLIAKATENFIAHIITSLPNVKWDYVSYVSDKATTIPPNKMKELFDLLKTPLEKRTLIIWKKDIKGSIRNQPKWEQRKNFVNENVQISTDVELKDKNIIIVDDQFTTGATAHSISNKLKDQGAKNIIFVTLFYLISTVDSEKLCPKCGRKLKVKIKRTDGAKFYSCVGVQYGGNGCGDYIENIK